MIYTDPDRPQCCFCCCFLVPRKIVILAFIFLEGVRGRERISSCYRLRPSGATPTHLGAKTNTQETRDQTRKYTHTPVHTLTHPLTLAKSIEAYFVLLLRRLYFVCVCFNLFLFISLFSPGHKGQSLPHFCLWYSRPFLARKFMCGQQQTSCCCCSFWFCQILFMDNEMEIDGNTLKRQQ